MKYETASILLAFFGLATAVPMPEAKNKFNVPTFKIRGREVPQEHSHEKFLVSVNTNLKLDNPDNIQDAVFGLLGNAAAAAGQGSITNTDCLKKETADRAFTNAKAAGDVDGMVGALAYAALERNTGGVGTASVICTDTMVNPEIQAIDAHQDPASADAAAVNKAIVLELAKQIKSVGGDPQVALETGTFAPGDLSDTTGAGNSCDDANDPVGCIYTQNLLVEDATAAEIDAAASGATVSTGGAAADNSTVSAPAAGNSSTDASCTSIVTMTMTVDAPAAATDATTADGEACAPDVTSTVTVDAPAATTAAATSAAATSAAATAVATGAATSDSTDAASGSAVGGVEAPEIKDSGNADRPFEVNGNTFVNESAAKQRACDVQFNACANASRGATDFSFDDCSAQKTTCDAA
ncbi:hypothetical protein PVAG01_00844 [Phlyctema vagabunda]|uniref:Cell wall mannoprotein n=1 Tax=Phlyctema vagabunda TaxID=108571 RepID=A0ABR4PVG1_9HELO